MVYQESHLDPKARSHTGVEGIMQLTQDTAREMGIRDRTDPVQSIMGGVRYLKKLHDLFDEAGHPDRLLIALASYNVGRGHVLDAMGIARDRGFDPHSWSALAQILPLLRYPKHYKKTRYGYCRGTEPVRYVNRILTYYEILKRDART
jgi:membrane-bound lytic murein transglycosylase F